MTPVNVFAGILAEWESLPASAEPQGSKGPSQSFTADSAPGPQTEPQSNTLQGQ